MEKLKNKIILVLFFILTLFLICILFIFNYQYYYNEKNKIENILMRIDDRIGEQSFKLNEKINDNPIYMDETIYTIFYSNANTVLDIFNHSNNSVSYSDIEAVAKDILNRNNNRTYKIGNLYFEQYSYTFKEYNRLIILDNYNAQHRLISLLKTSILIFVILEILIILVVLKITNWIIKPVIESFNKQKTFISDASHELKTPIAVIMANSEALENEPNEKKWLNNIKTESERMNNLISDLLDLAKLEDVNNKAYFNTINLSTLIEKSILTFESIMYEKKIKLQYDIQENVNFNCNNNQIKQLVAILIDNAIEYTEEDGDIIVNLKKGKNDVVLSISNKGKEIPKDIQGKIFERFYRADESRNRTNNKYGLGLAIAKNIVENHNGNITVQSANGYNTFIVKMKYN